MAIIVFKCNENHILKNVKINLTEAVDGNMILTEELSKNDLSIIEKLIDKKFNKSEVENRIKEIVVKEFNGKNNEKIVVDIVKNCMVQLYKQLWSKRSFWLTGINNNVS